MLLPGRPGRGPVKGAAHQEHCRAAAGLCWAWRLRVLGACPMVAQIWGTGLGGGARAVVLFNRHFDEAVDYDNSSITLHWHHLGWETDMPVRAHPTLQGLSGTDLSATPDLPQPCVHSAAREGH